MSNITFIKHNDILTHVILPYETYIKLMNQHMLNDEQKGELKQDIVSTIAASDEPRTKLYRRRKEMHMSRAMLSRLSGISAVTIRHSEIGLHRATLATYDALAVALKCDPKDLID